MLLYSLYTLWGLGSSLDFQLVSGLICPKKLPAPVRLGICIAFPPPTHSTEHEAEHSYVLIEFSDSVTRRDAQVMSSPLPAIMLGFIHEKPHPQNLTLNSLHANSLVITAIQFTVPGRWLSELYAHITTVL